MNIAQTLILLLTNRLLSFGQTVDTLKSWGDGLLVTDLKLDDNENCIKLDSSVGFHACNNYHGQDITLIKEIENLTNDYFLKINELDSKKIGLYKKQIIS